MIWWLAVPSLGVLAVLQSSVFRQIPFLDGGLDLLLLVVICWNLLRPEEGMVWALLAGLFADLFSGGPFGITSIAYLATAVLVGLLHGRFRTDNPVVVMVTALFATIVAYIAILMILFLFGHSMAFGDYLTYIILPTAFLNTLFATPVYLSLRRLHRATLPPALSEEEA
jgi:rod shape-determining protein MreD